jgi:hypothetical protein
MITAAKPIAMIADASGQEAQQSEPQEIGDTRAEHVGEVELGVDDQDLAAENQRGDQQRGEEGRASPEQRLGEIADHEPGNAREEETELGERVGIEQRPEGGDVFMRVDHRHEGIEPRRDEGGEQQRRERLDAEFAHDVHPAGAAEGKSGNRAD